MKTKKAYSGADIVARLSDVPAEMSTILRSLTAGFSGQNRLALYKNEYGYYILA